VRIIRVFVCTGCTIHRWMRLGPKLKMGEKNSCRVEFSDEFSPVPSRSEAREPTKSGYIDYIGISPYDMLVDAWYARHPCAGSRTSYSWRIQPLALTTWHKASSMHSVVVHSRRLQATPTHRLPIATACCGCVWCGCDGGGIARLLPSARGSAPLKRHRGHRRWRSPCSTVPLEREAQFYIISAQAACVQSPARAGCNLCMKSLY
jgi:hypothetical protein